MSAQDISAEIGPDLPLEIAHLLLIDIVGYSKLLVNEQIDYLEELNQIVRATDCFQSAEKTGKLIRLPTGGGMALLFFRSPEEPARCALDISRELKNRPHIQVRMGIHSGPVSQVKDVNETLNIAGAGINVARRVMDCGDAGHILLSKHVAEDLAEYRHWRPYLRDVGEIEAEHGLQLHLFSLHKDDLGNPAVPEKSRHRFSLAKHFLVELKRRNVYKVAAAYAVVSWLLIQVATQVFPFFEIPNWTVRLVVLLFILGFPVALILSWAFEITPEGIKRESKVAPGESRQMGRRIVGLTIVVAIIAAGVFALQLFRSKPSTAAVSSTTVPNAAGEIPVKSIAVLPFESLSDDKQDVFFADGVQDEILTVLARVADLKVISRTSVMQYRADTKRNLREIAQALGVAYILEGSVQRFGGRVNVYAQFVDARTDTQMWADKYERGLDNVFAIQSEVAEKIVAELKGKLSPSEKAAIERPPTSDLVANDLYAQARTIISNSAIIEANYEKLSEAVRLLDQAVKRDPSFMLAYYQLAHAHDQIYVLGYDHTPTRLALAETAVEAVQRLRPNSGEAHLALAKHLYWGYLDYDRAREELKFAQLRLPNEPLSFLLAGYIDRRQGRWEESTRNMERALELDPQNLLVLQQMSLTYENLRRYGDQAAILDRALALAPDQVFNRIQRATVDLNWRADSKPLHSTIDSILAEKPDSISVVADQWLYLALCEHDPIAAARALGVISGDGCNRDGIPFPLAWCEGVVDRAKGDANAAQAAFTKARAEVAKIVRDQPNYAKALCGLGMIDAALGRKEEAIEEGRRAVELLPVAKDAIDGALLMQHLAIIYAWSDRKEAALDELAAAAKLPGYLSYGHLRLHPYWDPLRGDPRFDAIVASLAPK